MDYVTNHCKDCQQIFFYEHTGGGPRRKYCDKCRDRNEAIASARRVKKFRENKAQNSQSAKHDSPSQLVGVQGQVPGQAESLIRLPRCHKCGMMAYFGICACTVNLRNRTALNVIR